MNVQTRGNPQKSEAEATVVGVEETEIRMKMTTVEMAGIKAEIIMIEIEIIMAEIIMIEIAITEEIIMIETEETVKVTGIAIGMETGMKIEEDEINLFSNLP